MAYLLFPYCLARDCKLQCNFANSSGLLVSSHKLIGQVYMTLLVKHVCLEDLIGAKGILFFA